MSEPKPKSFEISKMAVWEAYRRVKTNKGGAGVDGESMAEFEVDLKANLYKLWNRLSSGSYFPPPVRAVEIPKRDGSSRTLGVPTVADRIAQTVVRGYLEPDVEPVFHEDSYGYRPGRSAHQALRVCRERCWRADWVLDMDIQAFFDSVPWELVLKAVKRRTRFPAVPLCAAPEGGAEVFRRRFVPLQAVGSGRSDSLGLERPAARFSDGGDDVVGEEGRVEAATCLPARSAVLLWDPRPCGP